jgi:hypothetical protein
VDVMGIPLQIMAVLLILLGCAVLAVLALVARAQRTVQATEEATFDATALRAEAQHLIAHAAAAQARAGRAAAKAWELRERAAAAAAARDLAWQVQESAHAAYERARQDAARRDSEDPAASQPGVGDGGERDRTVSRAALSAYRRGDISVEQLREVWLRTGGWNPDQVRRLEAAEQAAMAERAARRGFDRAAADARYAEQAAQIAEIAAHALAEEATEAAAEAHEAMLVVQHAAPRRPGWLRRTT